LTRPFAPSLAGSHQTKAAQQGRNRSGSRRRLAGGPGSCQNASTAVGPGAKTMVEWRPKGAIGRSFYPAAFFTGLLLATPACFADQTTPLSVERPSKQTMVLTQGFSTTIHSERPFGKISITDPDIVDLVVRTDKSAVLIPQRLGRTNIDFLDDHGSLIGSMDVRVVRQSITDRVVIYNRPSLGAYSAFHCGPNGCAHFEEMPDKEEALSPGAPQSRIPMGAPQ
jgi:Pilus formation protein N terminal region